MERWQHAAGMEAHKCSVRAGGMEVKWLAWNAPWATFVFACILCSSTIVTQRARSRTPLSASRCPRRGNWRSRWNAADTSFQATNKSIKQHRHTDTCATKSSILSASPPSPPVCPLGCRSQGLICHQGLFSPHYSKKWSQHKSGVSARSQSCAPAFA